MSGGRAAEEWGRVAVALPGWRWMARMYARMPLGSGATTWVSVTAVEGEWLHHSGDRRTLASRCYPQVGDPATAGCLLAMLGPGWTIQALYDRHGVIVTKGAAYRAKYETGAGKHFYTGATLGRACIAAAEALGRWPGGE